VRERATRPPEAEIRRRVEELLSLVQLAGFEDRYPGQLSGGQRQRVALARALAIEPRVLLLDEPFGALDARVRKDLRRWLREIHDRTGQTTIFVTHDQEEALGIADRVAILKDGRIEQIGTPDDIHDDPASPFVMTFIGDTAALNIDIRNGAVLHAGKRLPMVGSALGEGPGTLYVRPGQVQIDQRGDGALTGRVVSLRRLPAGQRAEVRLHGSGELVEAELPPGAGVAAGQDVGVSLGKVRIFRESA
jgi:sulfate transport system ATP-binding protein